MSSGADVSRKLFIDDGRRERQLLLVSSIVVGRDPACDVSDDADSLLSRRHAEFSVAAGSAVVRDLGSRNGTFVNGARVAESAIRSGDVVRIGRLRVRYLEDAAAASAPPADAGVPPATVLDENDDRTVFVPAAVPDVASAVVAGAMPASPALATPHAPAGVTIELAPLVRFVFVRVAVLVAVVFVAVAVPALTRQPAAIGDGSSFAVRVGWLVPPMLIAAVAACGAAWLITRRITNALRGGADLTRRRHLDGTGQSARLER